MLDNRYLIPIYAHESLSGVYDSEGNKQERKCETVYSFEPIEDAFTRDASRTFWKQTRGGTAVDAFIGAPEAAELVETEPEGPGHKMLRIDGVAMPAKSARNHAIMGNYDLEIKTPSELTTNDR